VINQPASYTKQRANGENSNSLPAITGAVRLFQMAAQSSLSKRFCCGVFKGVSMLQLLSENSERQANFQSGPHELLYKVLLFSGCQFAVGIENKFRDKNTSQPGTVSRRGW
jgi:hypothetical protein